MVATTNVDVTGAAERPMPDVPMALLTSLPLRREHWAQIARNATWQTTRMNLNTFQRHGVFEDAELVTLVAARLADPAQIARAKALPYQLMMAYTAAADAPAPIQDALQTAMEIATRNVPEVAGKLWIFPDVSGSMHSPVTGYRAGSTTAVRCIDVAALIAASLLRRNPSARVVPFAEKVYETRLNRRDSVMTNAKVLSSLPAGGTDCAAPLRWMNARKETGDMVIYVSDNESWIGGQSFRMELGTQVMREWAEFKRRSPGAKMVCIDLQPYATTQAVERPDILNVGGFSDAVFDLIASFAGGEESRNWAQTIKGIELWPGYGAVSGNGV